MKANKQNISRVILLVLVIIPSSSCISSKSITNTSCHCDETPTAFVVEDLISEIRVLENECMNQYQYFHKPITNTNRQNYYFMDYSAKGAYKCFFCNLKEYKKYLTEHLYNLKIYQKRFMNTDIDYPGKESGMDKAINPIKVELNPQVPFVD